MTEETLVPEGSVTQAIDGLQKIIEVSSKSSEKTKLLLGDDVEEKLILVITFKKMPPSKPNKNVKILGIDLPFSIYPDSVAACIFVKDLEKKKDPDDDDTKEHFKTLLWSNNIKGNFEVIPLHQLRTEFQPAEAKQHLCSSYDVFLSDHRIWDYLPPLLGKNFFKRRRLPVKVDMLSSDLKAVFDKVLSRAYLYITANASYCEVLVSKSVKERTESVQNVMKTIEALPSIIPGGWNNIRSLYLKTGESISIPIYVSTGSANEIRFSMPAVKKRVVKDELPTKLNAKISVTPTGKVTVQTLKRKKRKDDDDDDETTDEEEDFQSYFSEHPICKDGNKPWSVRKTAIQVNRRGRKRSISKRL